jgi:multidrug efflux pump subunit AcrB
LSGVARYLFVPLAEAVVFAMLASYLLSRTVVPTMAKYLLKEHDDAQTRETSQPQSLHALSARDSSTDFDRFRRGYLSLLTFCASITRASS